MNKPEKIITVYILYIVFTIIIGLFNTALWGWMLLGLVVITLLGVAYSLYDGWRLFFFEE